MLTVTITNTIMSKTRNAAGGGGGIPPANTVAPVISGTAVVGQTLSSTTGTWTGTPIPTYTYQWYRGATPISGAISSTYTLVQADATFAVTCEVTATNPAGIASATSNALTIIDADAQAFFTASGLTGTTNQSAINQLVVDMKGYGIWTKMKAIYPFIGGTAASHKWNLKDPQDTNAAFRLVFNGGWTHSSTGATPNGTNGYADTFLDSTNNLSLNSGHMSYYSRTNLITGSFVVEMGSLAQTPDSYTGIATCSANQTHFRFNNGGALDVITATTTLGFFTGSRTASNVIKTFRNGALIINGTSASNVTSTRDYYIGASNFGTAQFFSTKQCAFSSIGDGLTDTEAANFYTAVQNFNTTLGRSIGPQTVSDPDAQAFVTAANIEDQVQAQAVNQLVIDMKAANIWTKMKAIYPFVGGTAASHKWNLKDPQDTNAAFRLTFSGGWTHSSTGALPNGTNGYANSFLSTSGISLNSVHLSYYSRTNNTSTGCEIGGGNSSPDSYTLLQGRTHVAPTTDTAIWINNGATVDRVAGVNTAAFFCGSRTASNVIRLFRNSTRIINGAQSSNVTSTFPIWLGAFNFAGTGAVWSNRECAFSSIGDGLTDTEAANFYTAVQNFNTTLSRQV